MTITLTPEHERIIQAQLETGNFCSVEEILDKVLTPFKPGSELNSEESEIAKANLAAQNIREMRKGTTLNRPEGMSLREYAHIGHRY